jgi:peptidoglycan hydrolase-like protein with peptidoglycan-binding domain
MPYLAFTKDLKLGDNNDDVKRLQAELKKFNLFRTEPTGYYGEVTQHAIAKFQQKKGIIEDISASGSGTFGPKTRDTFNGILGYRENTKALIAAKSEKFNQEKTILAKKENQTTLIAAENTQETEPVKTAEVFKVELSLGSSGEEVKLLQENLKKLGFYKGGLTSNYYGEITKDAVIGFQKANGIIVSEDDPGAGLVGPKTREILNGLI